MIATLEELDEDALINILTEPKNALVKQYQALFGIENVGLEFEEGALRSIARQAMERKTGARFAFHRRTLPARYDVPPARFARLEKVVVGKAVIEEGRNRNWCSSPDGKQNRFGTLDHVSEAVFCF